MPYREIIPRCEADRWIWFYKGVVIAVLQRWSFWAQCISVRRDKFYTALKGRWIPVLVFWRTSFSAAPLHSPLRKQMQSHNYISPLSRVKTSAHWTFSTLMKIGRSFVFRGFQRSALCTVLHKKKNCVKEHRLSNGEPMAVFDQLIGHYSTVCSDFGNFLRLHQYCFNWPRCNVPWLTVSDRHYFYKLFMWPSPLLPQECDPLTGWSKFGPPLFNWITRRWQTLFSFESTGVEGVFSELK